MNQDSAEKSDGGIVKTKVFAFLILLAIAVLPYVGTLQYSFVLDDLVHLVSNSKVHNLGGIAQSFTTSTFPGDLYRPMVAASYALTHYFWGLEPLPYHLTNVVLHAAIVLLLFVVLARLFGGEVAFWSAVLFAVHPLHTEVVANIHGRTELLTHLFGSTALVFLSGSFHQTILRTLIGGLLLLAAMLCKESALVYLLLIPLLRFVELGKISTKVELKVVLLAAAVSVLPYLILRFLALGAIWVPGGFDPVENQLAVMPMVERWITALILLGKYAFLSFVPLKLSADYSYAVIPPLSDFGIEGFLFGALFLILCVIAALGIGSRKAQAFGALWFILSFAVTANILFPIGTIFGERLAYLGSAGICVIIVSGLQSLPWPKLSILVIGIIASVFAENAATHSQVWRDNSTLHTYQMTVSARSVKTLSNYAVVLRNKGDFSGAIQHAQEALRILPEYDQAAFVLSTVFFQMGDIDKGREWAERTLRWNPNHAEALKLYGGLMGSKGR